MSQTNCSSAAWNERRLRAAADAAGVALWSWNVVTDEVELDGRARQLWGLPVEGAVTFTTLSRRIDPEDLGRVKKEFEATRSSDGAYEIDFRMLRGSEPRWISARGQGRDAALIDDVLYAVFMDVTERRQAEEVREMLVDEMSHRVKNLFAVMAALTAMAARSTTTKEAMEHDLRRRISGLGSAHDLVHRTTAATSRPATSLGRLLSVLLAPYEQEGTAAGRITIDGPDIIVGESGATALALVVHELATNSVKYGALSTPAGCLALSCRATGRVVILSWAEQGGPPVTDPKKRSGFGSKLLARSMSGHLGGSIDFDWLPSGLNATLQMDRVRLEL